MRAATLRQPLSITLRLALLFSAIAVICFFAVGAYLYQTLHGQMARRDDTELLNRAAVLRHVLASQASPAAVAAMPGLALNTVYGQDGLLLRILGPDGRVLAENTNAPLPGDAPPPVPLAQRPSSADIRDWSTGIGPARVLAVRAATADGSPVRVLLAREKSDRLAILRRYVVDLLAALCVGALLATLLGFVTVRSGMAPLRVVIGKANAISAHRLQGRLSVQDVPAELRELGQAFNAMLDRLEEGVQRLSGFAADLAHDLRTPINTLMMETQVALSRPRTAEEYQLLLASNLEEYERIGRMIENTLFLARADNAQLALRPAELDLEREVRRVADYFEGVADEAGVGLEVRLGADARRLRADPVLFQRALGNLVSNAVRHSHAGGAVVLESERDAGWLLLRVRNRGDAIPPEQLRLIFDRYYRADPARSGGQSAGLGLAIVRAIMQLHGGAAEARSTPAGDTCFELRFPLAAQGVSG